MGDPWEWEDDWYRDPWEDDPEGWWELPDIEDDDE